MFDFIMFDDDTQLYSTFDPLNSTEAVVNLEKCIAEISKWMHSYFFKLN